MNAAWIEFYAAAVTAVLLISCLADKRLHPHLDRYLLVLFEVTIATNLYAGIREIVLLSDPTDQLLGYLSRGENLLVVAGVGIFSCLVDSYCRDAGVPVLKLLPFLIAGCVPAGLLLMSNETLCVAFGWTIICLILAVNVFMILKIGNQDSQFHYLILLTYPFFPMVGCVIYGRIESLPIHMGFDLSVLLMYVSLHVSRGHASDEKEKAFLEKQAQIQQDQKNLIITQIQPHFIYNTLASILYLCGKDDGLAKKALICFSDYLRTSFHAFEKMELISFQKEMAHVQNYLWLEKLRFEDDLKVEYRLEALDFLIPSITIQPLVENAVSHGICQKEEGGTVVISSAEESDAYCIVIEDDGTGIPGPELERLGIDSGSSIGSIRNQLHEMIGGTLNIQSAEDSGTRIEIRIPKKGER